MNVAVRERHEGSLWRWESEAYQCRSLWSQPYFSDPSLECITCIHYMCMCACAYIYTHSTFAGTLNIYNKCTCLYLIFKRTMLVNIFMFYIHTHMTHIYKVTTQLYYYQVFRSRNTFNVGVGRLWGREKSTDWESNRSAFELGLYYILTRWLLTSYSFEP